MKSNLTYSDNLLLQHALKTIQNTPSYEEEESLITRQILLNEKFEFNDDNLKRIESINQLFDTKSRQAYKQAQQMESYLLNEMKSENSFVSDYEIDFNVSLFSEKKYANINEMEGNPFFIFNPLLFTFWKAENSNKNLLKFLFDENHNYYFHKEHPLKNQFHCVLFHDIYDHTYLAWQDIIDIDEIWIEVLVRIQNISRI